MHIFYFVFLFSFIYTQGNSSLWDSITSLLSPTDLQVTDEGIVYASTAGGLLAFNSSTEEFNFIKMEQGLKYLDLSTIEIDSHGRLWLGSAYPRGCLQIYDPERGLKYYKEWLANDGDYQVISINKIQIAGTIAFSVYQEMIGIDKGILKFNLSDDGLPEYQDYYFNFSEEFTITEIRDIDVFADSIFITTDRGIFGGNFTSGDLKDFDDWALIFAGDSAQQFIPSEGHLIVANKTLLQKDGSTWVEYDIGLTEESIQAEKEDGIIKILTREWYHEINGGDTMRFQIPFGDESDTDFTSFIKKDEGLVVLGMEYSGILILNKETGSYNIYAPDTPFTNRYDALTLTSNGNLAATSINGTVVLNASGYKNFIPNERFICHDCDYLYYSNQAENTQFKSVSLSYRTGTESPITYSIIEKNNGSLMFANSGILPNPQASITSPAVIELNYMSDEPSIKEYDSLYQIIDGQDGIYVSEWDLHYMVVNQIVKDKLGNIWVVNPYCERYGNLLAVQPANDTTWTHVHIPDENSYRPQTIAIEERYSNQRAWIGFAKEGANSSYSSGGIKVFQYTDLTFQEEDTTWIVIKNPNVLPGSSAEVSIWSMVFDHRGFLWVLSENGVQGYQISGNNEITLVPLSTFDFLTEISYVKGNRIKVDSRNNKWIITHKGVWVIKENMAFWPSGVIGTTAEGIHPENTGLLSDIVYDVAFDNDKGLAYLATDKGISILQIPFADNPSRAEQMYISPNPFIVPDDESVIIRKIPSGSTIQIMTITGKIIKKIRLDPDVSLYEWDGRNDKGEVVGTAVYLVAAHHPSEPNKVSKIAVIRK